LFLRATQPAFERKHLVPDPESLLELVSEVSVRLSNSDPDRRVLPDFPDFNLRQFAQSLLGDNFAMFRAQQNAFDDAVGMYYYILCFSAYPMRFWSRSDRDGSLGR
jgi:hypothetical protein